MISGALWLGLWTSELKVWGSILGQVTEVVPLDKEFYTAGSLFVSEYKWVPTLVGDVNLQQAAVMFKGVAIL